MLVDKKILESERNQVYVKSNEGVRLNGSVEENKNVFDKFPQLIMNKYNELIDLLIASGLDTVSDDLLNRYTKTETNSLVETETAMLVADVDIDLNTGVITVTKKDGSNTTIDTALEKVPSTFEFVEDTENDKFYLKVTNVDGTTSQTEVTNLMNQYTFSEGDIVSFVISKSGTTTTVTANIKNGSIGLAQLSTEVKQYYEEIKSSVSADRAAVEADKAVVLDASQTVTANTALALSYKQAAEENALLSKSYAIGNTGTRTGEDTDNSMYYSNEAKYARNQAQAAQAAAETAKTAAETAKAEAQTAATDASGSKTAAEQSATTSAQSAESAAQSASSASENATAAQQSKEAAALSEANALSSKNAAAKSATAAAEDKNLASASASAAQAAQEAAEKARDEAQEIVGGDYATKTELNTKENKATITTATLLASGWSNGTYSFETDYPKATYDLEIALDSTATTAQAEAFNGAQIAGSVTSNVVKAYGIVPTVDIPICIKVVKK